MAIRRSGPFRTLAALSAGGALALLTAACGGGSTPAADTSAAQPTIHVAQAVNTLIYLPLYVAEYEGFFARQHLNVSVTTASNGANAVSEVAAGSAQFSLQDPMIGVLANLKGAGVVSVAAVVDGVPSWIVARSSSGIRTLADLSGRVVTTANLPNTGTYLLQDTIRKQGLHNVKLNFVQIGAVAAPLLAGQTPATVVSEPDLARLQAMGGQYRLVYSYTHRAGAGYSYSTIVAAKSYLSTHLDVARRFVTALNQAEQAIKTNHALAIDAAEREFPALPKSVVAQAVKTLIDEGIEAPTTHISPAQYAVALKLQIALGNVKPGQAPYSAEVHNLS